MPYFTFLSISKTFICKTNTQEGKHHYLLGQGPVVWSLHYMAGHGVNIYQCTSTGEHLAGRCLTASPHFYSLEDQLLNWQAVGEWPQRRSKYRCPVHRQLLCFLYEGSSAERGWHSVMVLFASCGFCSGKPQWKQDRNWGIC